MVALCRFPHRLHIGARIRGLHVSCSHHHRHNADQGYPGAHLPRRQVLAGVGEPLRARSRDEALGCGAGLRLHGRAAYTQGKHLAARQGGIRIETATTSSPTDNVCALAESEGHPRGPDGLKGQVKSAESSGAVPVAGVHGSQHPRGGGVRRGGGSAGQPWPPPLPTDGRREGGASPVSASTHVCAGGQRNSELPGHGV